MGPIYQEIVECQKQQQTTAQKNSNHIVIPPEQEQLATKTHKNAIMYPKLNNECHSFQNLL